MPKSSLDIEKNNAARVAYDLELGRIERDLGFDLQAVILFLASEDGEIGEMGDRAASLLRHAWREFERRRPYARRTLQWGS